MKAIVIDKYGGNELVRLADMPQPQPGENEVLVEIHSASVNPVDFKIREGQLKLLLPYKFPLILGNDLSGVVVKVGSNVRKFKDGDRVYGRPNKSSIGCFAEYIAIHQDEIALMPKNLSFEEAASIPLVGLTSWQALLDIGHLQKGQKVFIQAGSGGVGSFAIQLAKEVGASVATTVSQANIELVKNFGADAIIDYKKEKFEEVLKNYDLVFDTLGGEALNNSFKVLKKGGIVVSIAGVPDKNLAREMGKGFALQFLFSLLSWNLNRKAKQLGMHYHFLFMKHSGPQLAQIAALIENKKIKPLIDKVFPLADTKSALAFVESGRARGKVIIKVK